MWVPSVWREPESSFVEAVIPPDADVCDSPLVCVSFNQAYLPYVLGCLSQGMQPTTWDVSDQAALELALQRWYDLYELFGTAMPCAPSVPSIPGETSSQVACNISGYLAQMVIREAMDRAIRAIQANVTVLGYGITILQFIPGAQVVLGIAMGLRQLYTTISAGSLSDYQTAVEDDALWGAVTCAIYLAISADGAVTPDNFAALQANVHAVGYPHSDVQGAIDQFISDAGVAGLQQLQPVGAMAQYDCTACGTGGSSTGPRFLPSRQDGGAVDLIISIGQTVAQLALTFDREFASPPLLTTGSDNPDVIVNYSDVTTTGCNLSITSAVPTQTALEAHVDWVALLPGPS